MKNSRFADRKADDLAWEPSAPSAPADFARAAVDACLDVPLSDREWNLLETQGVAADIKQRRRTPGQAAVLVEQWRDAVGGPKPRLRSESLPASVRAEAVAQLVAVEARKTQPVVDFRTRILKGSRLEPEQVDRWLGTVARRQEAKPWVKVYVSAEEIEMEVVPIGKANVVNHGYDTLSYRVPGSPQVKRILVSSKGILGWLHWLSGWLSERFLWQECDATTFVLTDVPPAIAESHYEVDSRRAFPALTRVMMTIDPTMSPREVANLYREVRFRHFGRRHRSMTQKHIELAKFWSERGEDLSWKDLMAEWNRAHRRWAYKREQNFARDCTQARERLLGQNLLKTGRPADETKESR